MGPTIKRARAKKRAKIGFTRDRMELGQTCSEERVRYKSSCRLAPAFLRSPSPAHLATLQALSAYIDNVL